MAAVYPGTIKTFTTKVNVADIVDASDPNTLQDEVVSIEATLGVNPSTSTTPSPTGSFNATSNSFASVSARLANIETGVVADTHSQYLRKSADTLNIITPALATNKGLVIKAVASQSANLQEWQNSSGTAVSYVDPSGVITGLVSVVSASSTGVGVRNIYSSTSAPTSGQGVDGDIWVQYV
jgi:hypothetical protein